MMRVNRDEVSPGPNSPVLANPKGRKVGGGGRLLEQKRHRTIKVTEPRPKAKWTLPVFVRPALAKPLRQRPAGLKFFQPAPIAFQRPMRTGWSRPLEETAQVCPHIRHMLEDKALSLAERVDGSGPPACDAIASPKPGRRLCRRLWCQNRGRYCRSGGRPPSFGAGLDPSVAA